MDYYFEHQGTKLRYQIIGQGQPLIYLHGVGSSTLSVQKLLELFARNFQVIAPDLPCFGKSSVPPRAWSYDDYVDFISYFLKTLNLKNIILAGHSFGGEIALRLANKDLPIDKLIIIGATGQPARGSLLKLIYISVWIKNRTIWKAYKNTQQMMLMRKDLLGNIFRKLPKSIRLARTVIKCIKSKIIWNRPVDIKTLLLWAENDEYLFWPDAEKLITYFPNATVKKLNEYHDWPVFKPDLLLQHIKDFINT